MRHGILVGKSFIVLIRLLTRVEFTREKCQLNEAVGDSEV